MCNFREDCRIRFTARSVPGLAGHLFRVVGALSLLPEKSLANAGRISTS